MNISSSAGSVGTYLASQSSHVNNASFYYLAASIFPFDGFEKQPYFPNFSAFVSLFFVPYTSMLSSRIYVTAVPQAQQTAQRNQTAQSRKAGTCRSETDNLSKPTKSIYAIAVPQVQHSTAQRNQPAQSRKENACLSECDNASKQAGGLGESQHMGSSICAAR